MQQDFIDYLKSLGFSDEKIQYVSKRIRNRNVTEIKGRVGFYKKFFNADDSKVGKFLSGSPAILSYDISSSNPASVVNKINFYQKLFHVTDEKIAQVIFQNSWLLHLDVISNNPTSVKGKITFLKNEMKISDQELRRFILNFPNVLFKSTTSLKKNLDYFRNFFGEDSITKAIITTPDLLILDCETIYEQTLKPFQALLKANDQQFKDFVKKAPSLLKYTLDGNKPESIESKLKSYKETFHLTENEALNFVIKMPAALTLDTSSDNPTSVKSKLAVFEECLPFDKIKESVLKTPNFITVPAQHFKIRYMLAHNLGLSEQFFKNNFMTNEQKIWARYKFLLDNGYTDFKKVNYTESIFKSEFKLSSEELMARYPLDEEAVKDIETTFADFTGRNLKLNNVERDAVLGR